MTSMIRFALSPLSIPGRKTREGLRYLAILSVFIYLPIRRTLLPPYLGHSSIMRTTVMQIYFTGVQALPIIFFLSLLMGLSLSMVLSTATAIQATLLNLILKEVAPLMAAFIILGRSATAITVELGNMTVLGEIRLLRRMGIDPLQHVVFPRLVGVTSATFFISIFFGLFVVTVTGIFSSDLFYVFIKEILKDWTVIDVIVLAEKGVLFGLIISMVACYQGLNLVPATTEVPKATIRTVIHCIILCATVDFLFKIVGV